MSDLFRITAESFNPENDLPPPFTYLEQTGDDAETSEYAFSLGDAPALCIAQVHYWKTLKAWSGAYLFRADTTEDSAFDYEAVMDETSVGGFVAQLREKGVIV